MSQRKTSFDLLKILAMLCIVIFHHFGTKVPNHFVDLTKGFTHQTYYYDYLNNLNHAVSKLSLLMDFCYGHFGNGSNLVFMLITGYFLFGRKIGWNKRLRIIEGVLFAIFFHGTILAIINFIVLKNLYPYVSYVPVPLFTLPNWLSGENLWYLQAYGVFILLVVPLLKKYECRLTREKHRNLILTIVFARFLAFSNYLPNLWISSRIIDFIMCYYIGGYISQYRIRIPINRMICISSIYIILYFIYEYYWRYTCSIVYKPVQYSYIDVMQPLILCLSFALIFFLMFNSVDIKSRAISTIASSVASTTIGIYIFHYNMVGFAYSFANAFWWNDWSRRGFFTFAILDSFLLFILGFILDKARQWSYSKLQGYLVERADT